MRILLVTRLFTGFETSLNRSVWKPEGLPTIYKLIERLDKDNELFFFLLAKDSGKTYTSGWKEKKDLTRRLKGLKAKVYVFAGINFFSNIIPKKLAMILRDFRHLLKITFYIYRKKPDIIYCDSSNVVIAAILKLIYPKIPLVLRVLGICSFLRSLLYTKKIIHRIYRLAFKSNFSAVIGTQEGSGIEIWFEKALRHDVKKYILLNGVDHNKINIEAIKKYSDIKKKFGKKILILFLGRLEEYKGIRIFLSLALNLLEKFNTRVAFLIVGDGSMYDFVKTSINNSNYKNSFELLRNVPHSEVMQIHKISDIYISTNKDGNLSNANLEAINSNDCILIPKPRKSENIDIKTYSLLKDSVVYYELEDIEELMEKVKFLILHPNEIKKMKLKVSKRKSKFIRSWKERIKEEEDILLNL